MFKGCVRYTFASCFSNLKETTSETWKNAFYFASKVLAVLKKRINFRILDIQISWRHQMTKHKTRNTFY